MSVAAASGAVSTHQLTQERISLARLIDDKKHDQLELQEMIRKVLDVVADSNPDNALVALHDCDYDCEKAIALLIEKGRDVASEWRTATSHKTNKKQQQQKSTNSTKNGQDGLGGDTDENGPYPQGKRDGSSNQKKSRGGRPKFQPQQHHSNQQHDGADFQNVGQSNEHFNPQYRSRGGGGSNYRGRHRGNRSGVHRGNDRNHQYDPQDATHDSSLPSDTATRSNNVSYQNRRGIDVTSGASSNDAPTLQEPHFDVGNWNGETLIYSRTKKENEQATESDLNTVLKSAQLSSEPNVQSLSLATTSSKPNARDVSTTSTTQAHFDPIEATLQIKNFIGIGQNQQQKPAITPTNTTNSMGDVKTTINNQSIHPSIKPGLTTAKSPGQVSNNKVTPTPPPRIPQQPVVFSDRFDGVSSKIDVEFGNLRETSDETVSVGTINISQPLTFYSKNESIGSSSVVSTNNNISNASSSVPHVQRSTTLNQHSSSDQSAFMTTAGSTGTNRISEQMPVMNQRLVTSQLQQQSITMKPVVAPNAYPMHQGQSQLNPQSLAYTSMLMHHPQSREAVPLDNAYDPSFALTSEFNTSYYMPTNLTSQQQGHGHYIVSQPTPQIQQVSNARPPPSNNAQTSVNASSSGTSTSTSTAAKKGPALPPGILVPGATGFSAPSFAATYGVSLPIGNQQQTTPTPYTQLYEHEHSFNSPFMQYNNPPSAQSPTGAYGSVTPPVQQQTQQQGLHAGNDTKTLNMQGPITENLLLLQQYAIQHPSNQQQPQQSVTHAGAPINYFLGHAANAAGFSPGHPIMYATAATPMTQQQQNPKQQGQHYNQRQTSSSNKEGHFMYATGSGQVSQGTGQSVGQQQQQQPQSGGNKQQRANNNVYNNQQNQQRPYQ